MLDVEWLQGRDACCDYANQVSRDTSSSQVNYDPAKVGQSPDFEYLH